MRLVINDDDLDQRHQIAEAFAAAGWIIVGHARDAEQAPIMVGSQKPDVVVVDPVLSGATADELLARLCQAAPNALMVVFATPSERRFVRLCHDSGADAYVLKENALNELVRRSDELVRLTRRPSSASPD